MIEGHERDAHEPIAPAPPQLAEQGMEAEKPDSESTQVERRSAVNEKPNGAQKSAPQSTCAMF